MSYNNFIRPEIEYLSLRLFILRIREDKKKPTYRIAYGVIVPSDHTMEKASVSEFSQLGRYGNKVYLRFITMCFALGKGTIIKQRIFLPLAYTICILSDKIAAPSHKKANRCRRCSCSNSLFIRLPIVTGLFE